VIASKSIAFKSASAISEILGIAPTPSTSATAAGSATPQGKLTPLGDDLTIEKITTSTKSVADYFKDKLLAKSSKLSSATPISTPEYEVVHEQDSYDTPRRGLGSSHFPRDKREDPLDTETRRMGISKLSSLMSSSFLAATITTISLEEGKATTHVKPSDDNLDTVMEHESLDDEEEKKRRNKDSAADVVDDEDRVKAKEERRRARAERRALKEKGRNSSSAKQAS
jgi:Pin2-interacting protein X1